MATVNTDIAQELDITCRRGDSFALSISFKATDGTTPIDISNYTFRMEVREEDTDDGPNPVLSADKCVIEVTSGTNNRFQYLLTSLTWPPWWEALTSTISKPPLASTPPHGSLVPLL